MRQPPGARRRASAAQAWPGAASEYMAASRRCPRIDARRRAARGAPAADTFARARTKPGRGFSPPSSRRASRRPPYEAGRVSKAAAPNCSNLQTEQGLAIRRCPKASPRHACGRGGRFDLASAATSRFLRRGGPCRSTDRLPALRKAATPVHRTERDDSDVPNNVLRHGRRRRRRRASAAGLAADVSTLDDDAR